MKMPQTVVDTTDKASEDVRAAFPPRPKGGCQNGRSTAVKQLAGGLQARLRCFTLYISHFDITEFHVLIDDRP